MRYTVALNVAKSDADKVNAGQISLRVSQYASQAGFSVQGVNALVADVSEILPPYRSTVTVNVGVNGDLDDARLRALDVAVVRAISDTGNLRWSSTRIAGSLPHGTSGEGRPFILYPVSSIRREASRGTGVPHSTASTGVGDSEVRDSNNPNAPAGTNVPSAAQQDLDKAKRSIMDEYGTLIYVGAGTLALASVAAIVWKVKR
jgi:hypothetical protein